MTFSKRQEAWMTRAITVAVCSGCASLTLVFAKIAYEVLKL